MPPPRMPRRCLVWPVVLVIVAGGMLLRLWHLNQRSLWFDEAFSWRLIQFPLPEMLWRAGHDNSPPLYYILLQGWVALWGESLFFLRLPSVLLGGAAVLGI